MLFTNSASGLVVLVCLLRFVPGATPTAVPTSTLAITPRITSPPALPTLHLLKKRAAATCSEWSIVNNGVSNWFTCREGIGTCILDSSAPYWHCGNSQTLQTWYTSCYDFPATLHSGMNNYCPQSRPYCGTWSIITDSKTYSTFGCDTTKADKTLVRRSVMTVTVAGTTVTAYIDGQNSSVQASAMSNSIGDSTSSHSKLVGAVVGSFVGISVLVLTGAAAWFFMKKKKDRAQMEAKTRRSLIVMRQNEECLELEEKKESLVVQVLEVEKHSL